MHKLVQSLQITLEELHHVSSYDTHRSVKPRVVPWCVFVGMALSKLTSIIIIATAHSALRCWHMSPVARKAALIYGVAGSEMMERYILNLQVSCASGAGLDEETLLAVGSLATKLGQRFQGVDCWSGRHRHHNFHNFVPKLNRRRRLS